MTDAAHVHPPEVVAARAISKTFGDGPAAFKALDDVSLSVREGQFISIVGPSGCGKSTLLQIIAGLSLATAGEVMVDGERIDGPHPDKIGVVFQEPLLLPWKTAAQVASLPEENSEHTESVWRCPRPPNFFMQNREVFDRNRVPPPEGRAADNRERQIWARNGQSVRILTA